MLLAALPHTPHPASTRGRRTSGSEQYGGVDADRWGAWKGLYEKSDGIPMLTASDFAKPPFYLRDWEKVWVVLYCSPDARPCHMGAPQFKEFAAAFRDDARVRVRLVLLPMPGGPDNKAARADGFCGSCLGLMRFFGSPRCTRSHWSSHFPSFERMSPFPIISLFCFGLWRSAHNPGAALGLSRAGKALTGGALSLNFASASCKNCLKALAPLIKVVFLSFCLLSILIWQSSFHPYSKMHLLQYVLQHYQDFLIFFFASILTILKLLISFYFSLLVDL